HYQPQFDIKEKTIIGFEALVRWNSPALGMISPLKFIGIAEENRMIIPLGEWILKRACEFIKQINKEYSCQYVVSVNISMIQLLQEDFVERVMNTLNELDLDPNFLELELTESILMQSFDIVIGKLNKLNNSGIRIALDDFGKGYSSLSYLRDLPISTLKIDKSFIDNIENIEEDTLTESIIYLGKRMGLLILAEGVETQKQLDYLANNECDRIQGYLLGKPMPENTVRDLLSREKNQNS
ncbi:MAG: EAL domain-containing protein, partial [Alkaliphilus sp.]|nr:EAL domain-containing protein [Alkaliphilus sp.]